MDPSDELMAPMPSKIGRGMLENLIDALLEGHTRGSAAWKAGITSTTLSHYMKLGEEGHPEYKIVYDSVVAAEDTYRYKLEERARNLTKVRLDTAEEAFTKGWKHLLSALGDAENPGTLPYHVAMTMMQWAANQMRTEMGEPSLITASQSKIEQKGEVKVINSWQDVIQLANKARRDMVNVTPGKDSSPDGRDSTDSSARDNHD